MTIELSEKDLLILDAIGNAFVVFRVTGKMPEEFFKIPSSNEVERVVREVNRQVIEQIPELEELAKKMNVLPDSPID